MIRQLSTNLLIAFLSLQNCHGETFFNDHTRGWHWYEPVETNTEHTETTAQANQIADHKTPTPDDAFQKRQLIQTVQNALDRLPPEQKTAIFLARYEGMSYQEIAETMAISLAAVKSLLFRAHESLKKSLASQTPPTFS